MGYIKPDKFLLYADDSHHGGAVVHSSCDSRELSGMRTADLYWMYGDKRGRTVTKKS